MTLTTSEDAAIRTNRQKRFTSRTSITRSASKIPVLIACNCDNGGSGACSDGTHIATAAACGASEGSDVAYDVGYVSGREGTAVGCSWDYGPVCDLLFNWRNTIVNTRAYGKDVDAVIATAVPT